MNTRGTGRLYLAVRRIDGWDAGRGEREAEGVHLRGIPRSDRHEITRNQMTHPPRIISRKRLIKPSEPDDPHGERALSPAGPCCIAYNYLDRASSIPLSSCPASILSRLVVVVVVVGGLADRRAETDDM